MEVNSAEGSTHESREEQSTYVFPPVGYVPNKEEMKDFEFFRKTHNLHPKDPALAPAQFRSSNIVIECKTCSKHFNSVGKGLDHIKKDPKHKKRLNALQQEQELKEASSKSLLPHHVQSLTKFVEETYMQCSTESREPSHLRGSVVDELEGLLGDVLPGVAVEFFGSSSSDLALKESDLNVNLNCCEDQDSDSAHSRIPEMLRKTKTFLESQSALYCDIQPDFYGIIPCITCTHIKSKLQLNIRAGNHTPAVQLGRLFKVYSQIDRRFRVLAVVFTHWAKKWELNHQPSGYYSSAMFHTMVLYFLQQRELPILPVLHELGSPPDKEDSDKQSEESSGTKAPSYSDDLTFIESQWQSSNTEPLGLLWFNLLKLYTVQLKFPEVVVSVRQSKIVKRGKDWPGNRLAIEHPFFDKHDLGKAVASQPAQDYLKSSLRDALVYYGNIQGQTTVSPPPTNEKTPEDKVEQPEDMTVQDMEGEGESEQPETEDQLSVDKPIGEDQQLPVVEPIGEDQQILLDESIGEDQQLPVVEPIGEDQQILLDESIGEDQQLPVVEPIGEGTPTEQVDGVMDSSDSATLHSTKEPPSEYVQSKEQLTFSCSINASKVRKRPVACFRCKQDGHVAKKCTSEFDRDLIDFGQDCRVSPELLGDVFDLMSAYVDYRGLTESDVAVRRRIQEAISRDISELYPTARLELFGSSGSGFGTKDSDLDLCMLIEDITSAQAKAEVIEKLFQMMKSSPGRKYNRLVPITSARVPIIKFRYYYKAAAVECDISIGNTLAVHNTRMLAAYARVDTRVAMLGHALKCLMKSCGVADASQGSFSSYAYIIILIHYLQRTDPPVLPVLQRLYKPGVEHKERIVGKWNSYFYDFDSLTDLEAVWPGVGKNKAHVVDLFAGLLKYLSVDFEWNCKVVSIRLDPSEQLDKFDKMWVGKGAGVEDPFDLSHNLGTVVSQRMFKFIHTVFMNTAAYLLGKGKGRQLTGEDLQRARTLEWLLHPKTLIDDRRAPVDPKFWDRLNRGEETTDRPPKKKSKKNDNKGRGRERAPKELTQGKVATGRVPPLRDEQQRSMPIPTQQFGTTVPAPNPPQPPYPGQLNSEPLQPTFPQQYHPYGYDMPLPHGGLIQSAHPQSQPVWAGPNSPRMLPPRPPRPQGHYQDHYRPGFNSVARDQPFNPSQTQPVWAGPNSPRMLPPRPPRPQGHYQDHYRPGFNSVAHDQPFNPSQTAVVQPSHRAEGVEQAKQMFTNLKQSEQTTGLLPAEGLVSAAVLSPTRSNRSVVSWDGSLSKEYSGGSHKPRTEEHFKTPPHSVVKVATVSEPLPKSTLYHEKHKPQSSHQPPHKAQSSHQPPHKAQSSHQPPHKAQSSHQPPHKVQTSYQSPHKAQSSHQPPHKVQTSHQPPHKAQSSHQPPHKAQSSHQPPHKAQSSHQPPHKHETSQQPKPQPKHQHKSQSHQGGSHRESQSPAIQKKGSVSSSKPPGGHSGGGSSVAHSGRSSHPASSTPAGQIHHQPNADTSSSSVVVLSRVHSSSSGSQKSQSQATVCADVASASDSHIQVHVHVSHQSQRGRGGARGRGSGRGKNKPRGGTN